MNGGNANHNGIHPNNGNGLISSIGNGLIPNNGNPQNNGNYANGPINGQVHVVPNQWYIECYLPSVFEVLYVK